MRRIIPIIIAGVTGIIVTLSTMLVSRPINALATDLIDWAIVLGAVALLLGVLNIIQVHVSRVLHSPVYRPYSALLLVSMILTIIIGISDGTNGAATAWIVTYVYRPLGASFFGVVAFFIVTAVYRGLRVSSIPMALMLATTVIVLIGLAPLEAIGLRDFLGFRDVSNWILQYPSVALQRGIILSTALGAILATLRIILGMDRQYLE